MTMILRVVGIAKRHRSKLVHRRVENVMVEVKQALMVVAPRKGIAVGAGVMLVLVEVNHDVAVGVVILLLLARQTGR